MQQKIHTDQLLADASVNEVLAAIALQGHTRRSWAEQQGIEYRHLLQVLNRKAVPRQSHAEALSDLLRTAEWPTDASTEERP